MRTNEIITCADHFSGGENQRGRSRFPNSHNNRGKSLWIVFCISCMHCNLFQIKFSAIQINCCNNILQLGWVNAQIFCTSWLFWVLLLVRSQTFHFRWLNISIIWWLREVLWNAPKRTRRRILSCDVICFFLWDAQKSNKFIFGPLPDLKSITWFILEIPHFSIFENFERSHFPIWFWKWCISKISNYWKGGISSKKQVTNFWTKKGTENEVHRFWGISKKNANSITWQKSSFEIFLGHFTVSPVFR